MEALLIDAWLAGLEAIRVLDEASLTTVRDAIRDVGKTAGASDEVVERACLVGTELGRNQLRHAVSGRIAVRGVVRGEHRGVELVAADRGQGLVDVASALDALPRAEGTLGIGIGTVRRLSSEVDFDVRVGQGTRVIARVLDREAPRRREIGIYGRPHPEERVSGDHAAFVRSDTSLTLAVCDGLGHGPDARTAAEVAVAAFMERAAIPLDAILEGVRAPLDATRGVVMAVTRIDEVASTLETAAVGNVDVQIAGVRRAQRFGGASAMLGGRRGGPLRIRVEQAPLRAGEVLVVSTDGLTSKLTTHDDPALLRAHPIVVAQRLVERYARATDDALVVVAR